MTNLETPKKLSLYLGDRDSKFIFVIKFIMENKKGGLCRQVVVNLELSITDCIFHLQTNCGSAKEVSLKTMFTKDLSFA
jgi:hypothetical protein